MNELANIGVIGLAVMGSNLARNFVRNGHTVALYNRSYKRTENLIKNYGTEGNFIPEKNLTDFVNSLEVPRRIILMVQAGKPTDAVITQITPLLEPGDIIVDGGNAFFADTIRREKLLREKNIHFVGAGISGGEEGALLGPSIMPGGSFASYQALQPYLESISAKVNGQPCVSYIGENGAGHFVKMVHNGIEYADMQFIAEAYDLLKQMLNLSAQEIAKIFRKWNNTKLGSFLIEITAEVLEQIDLTTGLALVDLIQDRAAQKGTGSWTVKTALDVAAATNTIAEAVFARSVSGHIKLRENSKNLSGPNFVPLTGVAADKFIADIYQALYAAKIIAYAQGFDQIELASQTYGWNINLAEVAKIWRGGCIIRAKLLDPISEAYLQEPKLVSLLSVKQFNESISLAQEGWREVVSVAVKSGIPLPGFSSALAYYDTVRAKRLPACLIQGLRDMFGAHSYERIDKPGSFHTNWSGDRLEKLL